MNKEAGASGRAERTKEEARRNETGEWRKSQHAEPSALHHDGGLNQMELNNSAGWPDRGETTAGVVAQCKDTELYYLRGL